MYFAKALHIPGRGWNVEVVADAQAAAAYPTHIAGAELTRHHLIDGCDSLGPHLAEWEAVALAQQINQRQHAGSQPGEETK